MGLSDGENRNLDDSAGMKILTEGREEVVTANEVATSGLAVLTIETSRIEARRLGQRFMDNLCSIKRLVQAESTYEMQLDVFRAFTAELLLPDHVVRDLEELIEWAERTDQNRIET